MFYLTFKFHDNLVKTVGFMEAQAQELNKNPGGIGLNK